MHFSKNHQGTLRNKAYYSQMLEDTLCTRGPHSEVDDGEDREVEESSQTWGLSLLGSQDGMPRVHSLLANLKHKRGN